MSDEHRSSPGAALVVSARWLFPIVAPMIAEGAVAIDEDGTVLAVGPRAEILARFGGAEEARADGALLPGLVNAHTHLELSALAGRVSGGSGLVPWAMAVAREAAGGIAAQGSDAADRAAHAAVAAGTVALGDVSNGLTAVDAMEEAGLEGVVFHELLGSRETRTGDAIADAARERQAWQEEGPWPDEIGYVLAPHAPYSADPALLARIFAAVADAPHPTTMHVAEDPDELALLRDGSGRWGAVLEKLGVKSGTRTPGKSPVAYLEALGAFGAKHPPLLVHMVHASPEDIALAAKHRAPVVLCPRSNLHIGGKLADVPALLAARVPLAIGTDSLASSPDLSLWGELATLAKRFPDLPAEIWVRAATSGGAQALALPHLGAVAPGTRPGLLEVSLEGSADPARTLVENANPRLRWIDPS